MGLEVTSVGERLKPCAGGILTLVDEAYAAIEAATGNVAGTLTIGTLETDRCVEAGAISAGLSRRVCKHFLVKISGFGGLMRKLEGGGNARQGASRPLVAT